MLYYLFTFLREQFGMFGAGVFYYITFRTAMAIILSLVIDLIMPPGKLFHISETRTRFCKRR